MEAQLAARRKQYKSPPTQALKERVRESCRTRIHAQRDDIFARCRAQRAMTASMLRSVILDVVDAECRMEDARAAGGDVDDGPPEFTEEDIEELSALLLDDLYDEVHAYEAELEDELRAAVELMEEESEALAGYGGDVEATSVLCPQCKKRWLLCEVSRVFCLCGLAFRDTSLDAVQHALSSAFEAHMSSGCHHDPAFVGNAAGGLDLLCDACGTRTANVC